MSIGPDYARCINRNARRAGRDRATRYGCRNGRRAIRCITSAHFYGLGRRYFASKSCARPAPEARSRTANASTFPALFRHDLLPASSDTAPARIRDAEPTEANIRDPCTRSTIACADPLLGPVFDAKLDGRWDTHLPKMVSFWSSLVLGTRGHRGNVQQAHQPLDGIEPAHFSRWLSLFLKTVEARCTPAAAVRFMEPALRIAQSLQLSRFGWDYRIPAEQQALLDAIAPRRRDADDDGHALPSRARRAVPGEDHRARQRARSRPRRLMPAMPMRAPAADRRGARTHRSARPVARLDSPARERRVVGAARIDPALAVRRRFLLPERRLGLQVIHHEFARRERIAAMRRDGRDHHDLVERQQPADPVHDRDVDLGQRRPASAAIFSSAFSVMPG
jgi:hemoglobin